MFFGGSGRSRAASARRTATDEALSFLDRHKTGPFFLELAYTIPHANDEKGALTGDGMEVPDYGAYANEPWPNPQKGHAALISRLETIKGLCTVEESSAELKLNKDGKLVKTLTVDASDGSTLKKFHMQNHVRGSTTTVETREMDTKVALPDAAFSPEALGQ